jgi:inward rectifier potassium channel
VRTKSNKLNYEKLIAILAPEKSYLRRGFPKDTYHHLITLPWPSFLFLTVLSLFIVTTIFGFFYYLTDTIRLNYTNVNGTNVSIGDAFFFSITSITTLGYGDIRAIGIGRIASGIESVMGLMFIGIFTALAFARISRARIKIHFSKHIVFDEHEGLPALLFRVTNLRTDDLVGAHTDFYFMKVVYLKDGTFTRRWYNLKLTPPDMPVFSFTWKVVHQIKEGDYFYGKQIGEIAKSNGIFLAILRGYDADLATESVVYNVWPADSIVRGSLPELLAKSKKGRPMAIPFEKLDEVIKRENNLNRKNKKQ